MISLPDNMPDRSVCILGMGFVGVTLSAVMAQIGFDVTGVEIRGDLVTRLNAGQAYFYEPGLTEQLTAAVLAGRLQTHEDIPDDCRASVYIITVGTPLGADGRVDLTSITKISRQIAARLKDGDLVLLRSTVKVGTTRQIIKPILKQSGRTFDLAFCPERTVEGQAMAELRVLPQIIGADSFEAGLRAQRLFQFLTPTTVRVGDLETAEMIKLVDNSARDLMFAYANEVAQMCDAVGISADEVIRSGRLGYARNGLPKPGPVGGPCLSKDPHILCESLEPFGMDPRLTRAGRELNEAMPVDVGRFVGGLVKDKLAGLGRTARISILGAAFKGRPSTDDVRGSTVQLVMQGIRSQMADIDLQAYDPVVPAALIEGMGLRVVRSLEEAFDDVDAVIVHTDHAAFAAMPLGVLARRMRQPALVYDFWNLFTERGVVLPPGARYVALGSHARAVVGSPEA